MKPILDKFSTQAHSYATFRPHYPDELFEFLFANAHNTDAAWDCGTGNGQVAVRLAERFKHVSATDISEAQLRHAIRRDNISYMLTRAEDTSFPDSSFDLITVAQAIHWFDFDAFAKEVRRVARKGALLAVWGYGLTKISPQIDPLISEFYKDVIGSYWDAERKHIDRAYSSVPFQFRRIDTPDFTITERWNIGHFAGYMNSWSAVQNYINARHNNPVEGLIETIKPLWNHVQEVRFPLFVKAGIVEK